MMDEDEIEEERVRLEALVKELHEQWRQAQHDLKKLPPRPRGRRKGQRSSKLETQQTRMASTLALSLLQQYMHEKRRKRVPDTETRKAIDEACKRFPKAHRPRVEEKVRRKEEIRIKVFDEK